MSGSEPSDTSGAPADSGVAAEADPLVGTVIADRYRVDARLGVGGMGAVYRAEHVLMKKAVAVKVLHREMTVLEEVVKRFEREAIAAGRIDHPNVTVATDFGKLPDGAFYLVLEYVPGRSLSKAIEEDGPFSAERALFIARQVAAALGAAHAADIVHRDLKPDNIMLIERGGTKDFVKVLDFGIAKVSTEGPQSQLTRIGSVFGTPQYMAPEQAAGKPVDGRADLYALGLVLYEMLSGKAAFVAAELVGILTKQLTEPPPPLPEHVDPPVRDLVMKLLEKDPALRLQSATELVQWIDAYLGPLALPPDSTVLGVPSLRNPSPAAVAATAAVPLEVPSSVRRSGTRRVAPGSLASRAVELAGAVARGESVELGGRAVPARLVAAAAAACAALVVLGVVRAGGSHAPPQGSAVVHAPPPAPELAETIAQATAGDRAAIAELEKRPEGGRTAAEWAAIGKGHARLTEFRAALPAFERAVAIDPSLTDDHEVLEAVRRAVDDDGMRREALELAADKLGAGGADVLFDVFASTSEKNETTALAKTLLAREDVRAKASKSLRVALDLRRTTRCEEIKKLLPEAKESADERAFRPLMALSSRRGCGFLGLGDCYSCIRQGDDLKEAQKAAQQRRGPRF